MNELQIFSNSEFGEIRMILINDEPYFVGKDVAEALGYANASKALADHVDNEDKLNNESLSSLGQRGGWLINESGLYSLVLSSKLPTAKKFKRWVTSEVLPSIRKTGNYKINNDIANENKRLEIEEMKIRLKMSEHLYNLTNIQTLSETYKAILISKSAELLIGENIIPLPKSEQKTYSATEIGEMFGISAQKIGNIAKKYNLKTEEYGSWYRDKSPYSNKEVDTFRYNDNAIEKFREILK
ncbi:MAG: Bro-N domain-containing protein [Lachnospiraceae bacterium]|nr:Bro-N domain-containing protein [Lachnospiraceae bacterium]